MIVQYIKRLWSTSSRPRRARRVPGVAVVEVVGETIRGLKGVRVAEEGLVAAEKGEACHG